MKIIEKSISQLHAAAYNPRKDLKPGAPEYEHLKKSIMQWDYIDPVVWNQQTGNVVGGHQRLKVLQELGRKKIQVSVVDLDPVQEKALNIALNKISGDWDQEKLAALIQEIRAEDLDVDLLGFTADELALLEPPKDGLTDPDDIPDIPEDAAPVTQPGDLWVLGKHRLLCGDCTNREDVGRLMDGKKAWMGLTSPPYSVGKEYEIDRSFSDHMVLLRGMADRAMDAIMPGGFLFLNFDEIAPQIYTRKLTNSKRQCVYPVSKDYWQIFHVERGMDLYAHRIWFKPFNKLQKPFWTYRTSIPHHQEWEHLWLMRLPGDDKDVEFLDEYALEDAGGEWEYLWTMRLPGGETDRRFVWAISSRAVWDTRRESPQDKPLTRHVAAFPVCLPERALLAHSATEALVWEPFMGSGSTLIACERLNRTCYGMEIEPHYCDVIVKRWEDYTGQKAVRNP